MPATRLFFLWPYSIAVDVKTNMLDYFIANYLTFTVLNEFTVTPNDNGLTNEVCLRFEPWHFFLLFAGATHMAWPLYKWAIFVKWWVVEKIMEVWKCVKKINGYIGNSLMTLNDSYSFCVKRFNCSLVHLHYTYTVHLRFHKIYFF